MTLAVSRAFMVGLDKQAVDTDSFQANGLAFRYQESIKVHRRTGDSTAVTRHQLFVFYMFYIG